MLHERCRALVATVIAWLTIRSRGVPQGAIKLDNWTFDKMLAVPDLSFLVKFDKSYAYGEKEDQWKTLSILSHKVHGFFLAEIPIQEYGDMENDDLRQRFALTASEFPVYFLFDAANRKGLRYNGEIIADDVVAWLRKNKIKMPAVGTIDELDTIARTFMRDKSPASIAAATKLAAEQYSADRKAAMYSKIMEKITEKGEEYLATEMARLAKLMKGQLTPDKQKDLGDKLNILKVFSTKDEL